MAFRAVRFRHRGAAGLLLALAALLAVTACGAPSYTYITNKAERTYAKVPVAWNDVSAPLMASGNILGLSAEDVGWAQAFDAASDPSIDHVLGKDASAPTMVLLVLNVPEKARGMIGLDFLRDAIFPVSEQGRMRQSMQPLSGLADFQLFADQTLTPGRGLRGVRTVYAYSLGGGPPQVFDQTGYVNDDASKMYLISIRCSLDCFKKRSQEIDNVASSFTVRETS